jgi:hypothetical protein
VPVSLKARVSLRAPSPRTSAPPLTGALLARHEKGPHPKAITRGPMTPSRRLTRRQSPRSQEVDRLPPGRGEHPSTLEAAYSEYVGTSSPDFSDLTGFRRD